MAKYIVNPKLPQHAGIMHDGVVYKRGDEVEMTKKQAEAFGKLAGVPRLVAGKVSKSPDTADEAENDN